MDIPDQCDFSVEKVGSGWVLRVTTHAGTNPVGPRILRGKDIDEFALRADYPTRQEALLACKLWEVYRDQHLRTSTRKEQIAEHKQRSVWK